MSSDHNSIDKNDFDKNIRLMTEFDLQPIMALENQAYDYPWTTGIMSDCLKFGYHCYVYEVDCEVRGYLIFSTVLDEIHLLNICIDPVYQNKGYGYQFLSWLISFARANNTKTIYLEVRVSNHTAIHLYQNLGFNEIGLRANYYPAKNGKEDAQLFACELAWS
ncbi:MAG: ribosomal protein S18-alanine N-acetyltransferase [gamma proteobacterium symbiont of Bathyaustriella thionipta]|nr:ribosomal protein S18-alanine N-acetyltransferase [gamma proteobacterium symbiont of Bathyaustriella thionipta]MCU7949728.1 ribosomal protein S18-alanine N-acetyltransferase [gamma proteobacterium symbiont of Bathyaustriella thionipta]MCU7954964.1 ribosomal protein S18-alanine N-acetyltransferase [gamma proteobacterium symbiont of Bathyaustriella thionipta]MCU7956310.1 ribosomal protein S18-alanine N-acetyltransferase [gamma proteobacterium symbiont of Bathyaustriella thionipta]MCU7968530.1 